MLQSASRNSGFIFVVNFTVFFAFFVSVCATETTKTKYLFHGYDLAVVAETKQFFSYFDDREGHTTCRVSRRDLPTMESPETKPAIVNVSDPGAEPDLPFKIECYGTGELTRPATIICPREMTPDNGGKCRTIAE